MPILKQKNAKSTGKVAVSKGFKPKVQVIKKKDLKIHAMAASGVGILLLTMGCQGSEEEEIVEAAPPVKKKDFSQPLTLEGVSEQNVHGGWQGKSAPYLQTGGFAIEGDFIYWRADEDGLDYATTVSAATSSSNSTFHQPDVSWDPGFKFGIGYTWEGQDFWDLFLRWTHLNTNQSGEKKVSGITDAHFLVPVWSPTILDQFASHASAHWKVRFNTLDLELGRNYFVCKTVALRPYVGLRGASILQNYKAEYQGTINHSASMSKSHMKAENNFKGIGARAGAQLKWHFTSDWSVIGSVAGSLLCGWYDVDQNLQGVLSLAPMNFTNKDNFTKVATNLEASLGFEWEYFFSDDYYRFAISASYEFSEWFSQNKMKQFNLIDNTSNTQTGVRSYSSQDGDLGLQGATVQLRFDF